MKNLIWLKIAGVLLVGSMHLARGEARRLEPSLEPQKQVVVKPLPKVCQIPLEVLPMEKLEEWAATDCPNQVPKTPKPLQGLKH